MVTASREGGRVCVPSKAEFKPSIFSLRSLKVNRVGPFVRRTRRRRAVRAARRSRRDRNRVEIGSSSRRLVLFGKVHITMNFMHEVLGDEMAFFYGIALLLGIVAGVASRRIAALRRSSSKTS